MNNSSYTRLAAVLLLMLAASCATPPVAPPPPVQAAEALPVLSITKLEASAIDQHRSTLTLHAEIYNPRSTAVVLLPATLRIAVKLDTGSHELGTVQTDTTMELAAFSESTFTLQMEMDTRKLDQDLPGFKDLSVAGLRASLTATAQVRPDASGQPASGQVNLVAEAEAPVQLIREPDLRILGINLVKHELINVILEVVIEVSNPNAFPLEFDQLAYDFFGEGKRWSRGKERKALLIPAKGAASTTIPVILNFTEMDRRVFDLVEKLQVVNYRLSGTATVRTGLDFLPEFTMGFERPGAVKVERTLGR